MVVWQKAQSLSLNIYQEFALCKDYGFKDQIQRASISIMNNIAEGYARRSDKALSNFLVIARGSAAEVESMIIMSYHLQYIDQPTRDNLLVRTEVVAKLLNAFTNKIASR